MVTTERTNDQPGEPSASPLVEQWTELTFAIPLQPKIEYLYGWKAVKIPLQPKIKYFYGWREV